MSPAARRGAAPAPSCPRFSRPDRHPSAPRVATSRRGRAARFSPTRARRHRARCRQCVDRHVRVTAERRAPSRGGDEHPCAAGVPKRHGVTRGEVDPSRAAQQLPFELIGAARLEALADRHDRPLARGLSIVPRAASARRATRRATATPRSASWPAAACRRASRPSAQKKSTWRRALPAPPQRLHRRRRRG